MNDLLLSLKINVSDALNGLSAARQAFTSFVQGPLKSTHDSINALREQNRKYERSLISLKRSIDAAAAARLKANESVEKLKQGQKSLEAFRERELQQLNRLRDAQKKHGVDLSLAIAKSTKHLQKLDGAILKNNHDLAQAEQELNDATKAHRDYARQIATADAALKQNNDKMRDQRLVLKESQAELRTTNQLLQEFARNTLSNVVTAAGAVRQIATGLRQFGLAIAAVGAITIAAFGGIAASAAETEASLAAVRAVMPELRSGTEQANAAFQSLSDTLREQAAVTIFTIQEVTAAAKALGQAGFEATEVAAAIPAILQLAAAGFIETADAAKTSAEIIRGFGLQASSLSFVVDSMAVAQSNSIASINDMRQAFSYATAAASAFNQRASVISETLAVLANQGIRGSRAGTGLAQIMSRLSRDVEKTTAFAEKLGLTFRDLDPTTRSLTDIIKSLQGTSVTAGDALKFFGERAGRTMLALVNASEEQFAEIRKNIEEGFGEALIQAGKRAETVAGSMAILRSKIADLFQTIGNSVLPDLTNAIRFLGDAVDGVNQFLQDSFGRDGVRIIVLMTTAIAGLAIVFGTLSAAAATFLGILAGLVATIGSFQLQAFNMKVALESAQIQAAQASMTMLSLAASLDTADDQMRDVAKSALAARTALAAYRKEAMGTGAVAGLSGGFGGMMAGGKAKVSGAMKGLAGMGAVTALTAGFSKLTAAIASVGSGITSAAVGLAKFIPLIAIITAAITALTSVGAAFFKAFDPTKNVQAWRTFSGLLHRIKEAVVTPFIAGITALGRAFDDVTGGSLSPLQYAMDTLSEVIASLIDSFLDLAESALGQKLFWLVGVVTSLVGALGKAGLWLIIEGLVVSFKLLEGAVRLVQSIFNGLWTTAEAFITLDFSGVLDAWLNPLKKFVGIGKEAVEVTDEMRAATDAYLESLNKKRRTFSRTLTEFEEYASLVADVDNLSLEQLKTLIELHEEYGNGAKLRKEQIDLIKQERDAAQEMLDNGDMESGKRKELEQERDILSAMIEKWDELGEVTEKVNGVAFKGRMEEAEALRHREELIQAVKDAEERVAEAIEESDKALEKLISKQEKLKETTLGRIEAERKAAQDKVTEELAYLEALAEQQVRAGATDEEWFETQQKIKAAKQKQVAIDKAAEALAAAEEREFLKETEKLEKKREIEILNLQGKTHEAKMKQIELEYAEAMEREYERFKQIGINDDALLKERLAGIREVRDEKMDALQAEIEKEAEKLAEQQKKEAEKQKKEKEAAKKKVKMEQTEEEKLMDKAVSNLAQRVQSTRDLVALNRLLLGIEAEKQRRARAAVNEAMRTQSRADAMRERAGKAETPEQRESLLAAAGKTDVRARLAAMFAGQAVSDAGGSQGFADVFKAIVGDAGGDGASAGPPVLVDIKTGMMQAVQELQAIRTALGGQVPVMLQEAANVANGLAAGPAASENVSAYYDNPYHLRDGKPIRYTATGQTEEYEGKTHAKVQYVTEEGQIYQIPSIPIDKLTININGVEDPNANAEAVMAKIREAALNAGP